MQDTVISVSELVALINQTLDFAYPVITVEGEVANFRVSKGRWIYFDLKDDNSLVRFFASVYSINTPIEDGMMVKVTGNPRLHNLYGFSVTVQSLTLSGEGTIKRAQELLKAKLEAEGLFAIERKRTLPKFPQKIGLVASSQSAAYGDFIKIINSRWGGLEIELIDVQVQGDPAVEQIVSALNRFSQRPDAVDVLVVIRGGGSPEDLAAFSAEPVVRAIAASRIPTIVGIGHETDVSLAELAADVRASTPTNAAQIVVPDRGEVIADIDYKLNQVAALLNHNLQNQKHKIDVAVKSLASHILAPSRNIDSQLERLVFAMNTTLQLEKNRLHGLSKTLSSLDPKAVLKRGYSLARLSSGQAIKSASQLTIGQEIMIEFSQGQAKAEVLNVKR